MYAMTNCNIMAKKQKKDGKTPHVASGRNSGFDVIFFCLGKRPGGSDSNRVFSMSEPKSEFFRGTLFFQVENLGEKVEETLKIVKSEQL